MSDCHGFVAIPKTPENRRLCALPSPDLTRPGSSREGEQIALHARGVVGLLQFEIDLFQIAAHARQHAASGHGLEIFVANVVLAAGEVFDAIVASEKFSEVERINVNFVCGGHEAAD